MSRLGRVVASVSEPTDVSSLETANCTVSGIAMDVVYGEMDIMCVVEWRW